MTDLKYIVRNAAAAAAASPVVAHPFNPEARRRAVSLSDATALTGLGVFLNVVAPGDCSTETHVHDCTDEFVYVISGKGVVLIDGVEHAIEAGDFVGFPASGPAHNLVNRGTQDLVYLVAGGRSTFDVVTYPRLGRRLYVYPAKGARTRDVAELEDVKRL